MKNHSRRIICITSLSHLIFTSRGSCASIEDTNVPGLNIAVITDFSVVNTPIWVIGTDTWSFGTTQPTSSISMNGMLCIM